MKDKRTSVVLLLLVLAIWGGVLYRILWEHPAGVKIKSPEAANGRDTTENTIADTFALLLDYPDPFSGKRISSLPQNTPARPLQLPLETQIPIRQNVPPVPPDWSFIQYNGFATNKKDTLLDALVSIRQLLHHVNEGSVIEGVEIRRIWRDSIRVAYLGSTQTLIRK